MKNFILSILALVGAVIAQPGLNNQWMAPPASLIDTHIIDTAGAGALIHDSLLTFENGTRDIDVLIATIRSAAYVDTVFKAGNLNTPEGYVLEIDAGNPSFVVKGAKAALNAGSCIGDLGGGQCVADVDPAFPPQFNVHQTATTHLYGPTRIRDIGGNQFAVDIDTGLFEVAASVPMTVRGTLGIGDSLNFKPIVFNPNNAVPIRGGGQRQYGDTLSFIINTSGGGGDGSGHIGIYAALDSSGDGKIPALTLGAAFANPDIGVATLSAGSTTISGNNSLTLASNNGGVNISAATEIALNANLISASTLTVSGPATFYGGGEGSNNPIVFANGGASIEGLGNPTWGDSGNFVIKSEIAFSNQVTTFAGSKHQQTDGFNRLNIFAVDGDPNEGEIVMTSRSLLFGSDENNFTTFSGGIIRLPQPTTVHASLYFTTGVNPDSCDDGDMWFNGTHYYGCISGTPVQLDN